MVQATDFVSVVAIAISEAKLKHPDTGGGTDHDHAFQRAADSLLFSKAVIEALDAAGYTITPNGEH